MDILKSFRRISKDMVADSFMHAVAFCSVYKKEILSFFPLTDILKVARSIADLDQRHQISTADISEAHPISKPR